MSAPTTVTDLQVITACEDITNWTALGGGASGLTQETDFFLQGSFCVSKQVTVSGTLKGMWFNSGSTVDLSTGRHAWFWVYMSTNQNLATVAGGGLRVRIGGATNTNFKEWYAYGAENYSTGGWKRVVVDPTSVSDTSGGTLDPTACQWYGAQAAVIGSAKSTNLGIDAMHHGSGHRIYDGDSTHPGSLQNVSDFDDTQATRYGVVLKSAGAFQCAGRLIVGGTGSNFTRFVQATASLNFAAPTVPVTASFMGLTITGSQTTAIITDTSIRSLSPTYLGDLIVSAAATASFSGGSWTALRTIWLHPSASVDSTAINFCGKITLNTGTLSNLTIKGSTAAVAVRSDKPSNISSVQFISAGTGHAIECRNSGTYTFSGNKFSGYAASDGTTGNEAFYNNSSGSITLNVTNGGGTPTVRNGTGASTTINNATTYTLTGIVNGTEVTIVRNSDSAVLFHVESSSGGTQVYSYNYTADTSVTVLLMNVYYEPVSFIDTLTSSAASVPVTQVVDRNYS